MRMLVQSSRIGDPRNCVRVTVGTLDAFLQYGDMRGRLGTPLIQGDAWRYLVFIECFASPTAKKVSRPSFARRPCLAINSRDLTVGRAGIIGLTS
jgi:hypothetical protein